MLKPTKDFYELTKFTRAVVPGGGDEPPIAHVKVFHKEYPRFERVALPEPRPAGPLDELYALRESTRDYTGERISLPELASVLASCRLVDPGRQPERRTYPSAGGRFPVETYVVAFAVEGLKAGCYHYAVVPSALELLWEQDLSDRSVDFVSPFVQRPSAALVFTSVIARAEVKYGYRAYPMSLIEAGHMGQNVVLTCAHLGLGCCPILGFVNDTVVQVLDLTADEIPVYVMALGRLAERSE